MDRRERVADSVEPLRAALEGKQAELWTALPGLIESYDPEAQTASVQPALKGFVIAETGEKESVDLPLLVDVPVVFPTGGGFSLTFPVRSGDECLVVFASRCIDGWWASGGVQPPLEGRMHDLSDGFALVGPRSQTRLLEPPADDVAVQLRSDDGRAFVEIDPTGSVWVEAAGSVTATARDTITLNAPEIRFWGNVTSAPFDPGLFKGGQ